MQAHIRSHTLTCSYIHAAIHKHSNTHARSRTQTYKQCNAYTYTQIYRRPYAHVHITRTYKQTYAHLLEHIYPAIRTHARSNACTFMRQWHTFMCTYTTTYTKPSTQICT